MRGRLGLIRGGRRGALLPVNYIAGRQDAVPQMAPLPVATILMHDGQKCMKLSQLASRYGRKGGGTNIASRGVYGFSGHLAR